MALTWLIDKQFSFCYGHRVWSQELIGEYCERGDTETKCRHLHGHEGLVHVFLEGTELKRGMVTDFKHLGWLKNFLDDTIDHKFIVDYNDPWFSQIIRGTIRGQHEIVDGQSTGKLKTIEKLDLPRENGHTRQLPLIPIHIHIPNLNYEVTAGYIVDTKSSCNLDGNVYLTGPEKEFYEGFFIVDFVPTSENLCAWLFDIINHKMSAIGVKTKRVDWFETPKSRSSVSVD